ncbi:MAG TPA: DUF423 domain-containing protein [Actinomycetota bacterium]|nr:DUF423 domain-containing protein [Actinomycetota bacterium]
MERAFLLIGAVSGLIGVALGAFGTHALRTRLPPERLASFETGVRYQLWHALALFAVVLVGSLRMVTGAEWYGLLVSEGTMGWPAALAGWLFVAGTVLFCGSLYAVALTGNPRWGAVAPVGGTCLLLGWASLVFAAATA